MISFRTSQPNNMTIHLRTTNGSVPGPINTASQGGRVPPMNSRRSLESIEQAEARLRSVVSNQDTPERFPEPLSRTLPPRTLHYPPLHTHGGESASAAPPMGSSVQQSYPARHIGPYGTSPPNSANASQIHVADTQPSTNIRNALGQAPDSPFGLAGNLNHILLAPRRQTHLRNTQSHRQAAPPPNSRQNMQTVTPLQTDIDMRRQYLSPTERHELTQMSRPRDMQSGTPFLQGFPHTAPHARPPQPPVTNL